MDSPAHSVPKLLFHLQTNLPGRWVSARLRGIRGRESGRRVRVRDVVFGCACALLLGGPAAATESGPYDISRRLNALEALAIRHPAQAAAQLQALTEHSTTLDAHTRLRVDVVRLLIADAQYRPDDVLALSQRTMAGAQQDGDPRLLALIEHTRDGALYLLGRNDDALVAQEREMAWARRTGDEDLVAQAYVDRAGLLMRKGDFEQACAAVADAERHARGPQITAEAAFSNALLAKAVGDTQLALQSYGDAYNKFQIVDDRTGEADAQSGYGAALNRLGRSPDAIAPLTLAIAAYGESGDHEGEAIAGNELALAQADMGRVDLALVTSAVALKALSKTHSPENLAALRIDRAALLLRAKRADEAIGLLERAQEQVQHSEDTRLQVRFHDVASQAQAATGRYRAAFEEASLAQQAQRRRTEQLVARQLAAQRGRLESELLTRENTLLRGQAEASERALQQARRAERSRGVAVSLAALLILGGAFALWRQAVLLKRIARMAQTDPLTGVPNRRQVLELGQRLMQRCRQDGRPYAMLLLDLDGFKQINDRFGHAAGDAALCAVADTIRRCIRPCDHLGRYGGEEFAVLLPGADEKEAGAVAERLRTAVASLEPTWAQGASRLTLSGGIALATSERPEFAQLLMRADEALYSAKNSGRNRIALAVT